MEKLTMKDGSCIFSNTTLDLESRCDGRFFEKAMLTRSNPFQNINLYEYYSTSFCINKTEYYMYIYRSKGCYKNYFSIKIKKDKVIVQRYYKIQDKNRAISSILINALWDINNHFEQKEKVSLNNTQRKNILENIFEYAWLNSI
ncbi:hypothetical protein [Clostridium perfringens]|uniref:hypothetical protein n=1 Tax=Clostridium perfringens TaxID=1502 RepID=UPI000F5216A8|nr:hypothetical protein [Clostridium perfringens]ELC8383009.1 hypothetical protein [Clostridium perfringens]MDT7912203.1 hypothetical protein [Clostridium perfringens]MDT7925262.1 hypothetical protein [Clostridium perfringens]MDT7958574.1 hypothetical protein [Clostridium perfringens]MDT7975216.1 hypothetical protein [Clostridium perfringens]